jgi:hypothetical protein
MKTLSVKPWWAWAIIHGAKRIENRFRPVNYRGPLAIHASGSRRGLDEDRAKYPELPDVEGLVFGAMIGVVQLEHSMSIDELREMDVKPFPRYAVGPHCWLLAKPRALARPIVCTGQISFFETELGRSPEFLPPSDLQARQSEIQWLIDLARPAR